jgi:hypothetical protein
MVGARERSSGREMSGFPPTSCVILADYLLREGMPCSVRGEAGTPCRCVRGLPVASKTTPRPRCRRGCDVGSVFCRKLALVRAPACKPRRYKSGKPHPFCGGQRERWRPPQRHGVARARSTAASQ